MNKKENIKKKGFYKNREMKCENNIWLLLISHNQDIDFYFSNFSFQNNQKQRQKEKKKKRLRILTF